MVFSHGTYPPKNAIYIAQPEMYNEKNVTLYAVSLASAESVSDTDFHSRSILLLGLGFLSRLHALIRAMAMINQNNDAHNHKNNSPNSEIRRRRFAVRGFLHHPADVAEDRRHDSRVRVIDVFRMLPDRVLHTLHCNALYCCYKIISIQLNWCQR